MPVPEYEGEFEEDKDEEENEEDCFFFSCSFFCPLRISSDSIHERGSRGQNGESRTQTDGDIVTGRDRSVFAEVALQDSDQTETSPSERTNRTRRRKCCP